MAYDDWLIDCVCVFVCVSRRAHVTNTQLGQEELSGGVRLVVRGNSETDDVPARIVIAPRDTEVVRGSPVTELHCIANARYVLKYGRGGLWS
jgi:hypothetical protein